MRRDRKRRWSSSSSDSSSSSSSSPRSSSNRSKRLGRSPRRSRSKGRSKSPLKGKGKQRSRSPYKGRGPRKSQSPRRSRSPRRNRSKQRSKSSDAKRNHHSSQSPRGKPSSHKKKNSGRGRRTSFSKSPRPNRSALKKKKPQVKRSDSDSSDQSVRKKKKKPGRGKRSDSEFSSRSIRNKAKRVPRRNSSETGSDRDNYVKSSKNIGFGARERANNKHNPRESHSSSENDSYKFPVKAPLKKKKLSPRSELSDKYGNRQRSRNKQDSLSSDDSRGSRYKSKLIHNPRRDGRNLRDFRQPRLKKKGNAKLKARFDRADNDNHGPPFRKNKKSIMSDGPPRGMNSRKKKTNLISQIRQMPKNQKNAPLLNPQRPIVKQPLVQKKSKAQEANDSEMARLRLQLQKLQNELSAVKNSPPMPPDTIAINKKKLEGLIDGTILKDAGGVENAIASLVNKRQELEGQLVNLKNELQKKNDVEKNLESMKNELQRNLERIEKNSQAMSPSVSKSDDTIYSLSQRLAAVEQEHREIRQKEMMRYPMPSVTSTTSPMYYHSPTPMQPVVHIHPSTPYKQYQRHYHTGRDIMYHKPTHYSPSPGEPPFPHNSYDRHSEGSFADSGDIAELCSALAATVDLVKKVINVDA